jgi:phosphoglycolate phosphatase
MTFKAVIFDLDGTLLDTIEDLTEAMNAALGRLGYPPRSIEECKNLVGDGLETYVRRALPRSASDDPAAAARLKVVMREEYNARCNVKTHPYPGVKELLDGLSRRSIPMAVLSNKPHEATTAVMEIYFSGWTFAVIYGARDGVPVKPDPQSALEIARHLGFAPSEIVYLGDTNTDMRTAAAARMFAVGALWGFRTAEELTANGAKILIARPTDLLALF